AESVDDVVQTKNIYRFLSYLTTAFLQWLGILPARHYGVESGAQKSPPDEDFLSGGAPIKNK
ncbi:MAG: hypothetical protein K2G64_01740, partial [Muribaculaceae bacterium]|nr:hypothetical protein [Muribaculaceae bacterium]